jgi:RNA polymerase sigma-70 factor, ECF subfamily
VSEKDFIGEGQSAPAQSAGEKRPAQLSDPERWVEEHGDYLFKYAFSRVRDAARAEDLVQETFLAALKGGRNFAGKSAEKTWLIGIMKNKIADYFRKASRETSFTDLNFYENQENEQFVGEGFSSGSWVGEHAPTDWDTTNPGANLDNDVFWKAFRKCAGKLPKNISAAFQLREIDDIETKEVCRILNISESNLWVMLHRARMALRKCLETNWFGKNV